MAKSGGMQAGMSTKNPSQMHSGDPKKASSYPSVDGDAQRSGTAKTPKSLGPRNA